MAGDTMLWAAVVGGVNLVLAVSIGAVGYFVRGVIAKAEVNSDRIGTLEAVRVASLEGEVGVLRERINGVGSIKDDVGVLRKEFADGMRNLRDELRGDLRDLKSEMHDRNRHE
jgi:hypothetical protein